MTFLYNLNRGDMQTEGEFFFKVSNKVKMLLIKIWFLVFSFSFWFQFIQRIDQILSILNAVTLSLSEYLGSKYKVYFLISVRKTSLILQSF